MDRISIGVNNVRGIDVVYHLGEFSQLDKPIHTVSEYTPTRSVDDRVEPFLE
jgi:hypothetical protein